MFRENVSPSEKLRKIESFKKFATAIKNLDKNSKFWQT